MMMKLFRKVECNIMNRKLEIGRILKSKSGEGTVDSAVHILISVVLGALLLTGLYSLLSNTILPTLGSRISDMFSFSG